MNEYTDLQRLAVAQALCNALGEETKRGGGLRDRVDAEILAQYEADGIDRKRIHINGVDVGTLTVQTPKNTRPRMVVRLDIPGDFAGWVAENARFVASYLVNDAPQVAEQIAGDMLIMYGELPDGCRLEEDATAKAPRTVLRVKREAIAEALGAELPAYVAGVLTDGA